ncbi:hypothetical protein FB107DRAFT_220456 [Schizophyllum commune]
MTPGNMPNRDVPCSLRSEEQPPRPPDADTTPCPTSSGTTSAAAGSSASSSSDTANVAPPRFKHKTDVSAMSTDEQPSQFLRDVQSLINKRRSHNSSRQLAIRVQYHDFSSRTVHPPPLFQSWVDKLIKKSGP